MNALEALEKHGRYGDTMMKKIDGDLAHVNAVEYEMSPEYIKEHGAGTTNPITGKKEYWGWVLPALAVGKAIYKGIRGLGVADQVEEGKSAAYDVYQEQLGLIGEEQDLATSQAVSRAGLGMDVAQSQYSSGVSGVGFGTNLELRRAQASGKSAYSQSNLATSGTIEQRLREQTGSTLFKYQGEMENLFASREHARKQSDITLTGALTSADLTRREREMKALGQYEEEVTQLGSIPGAGGGVGGFLESMFS